MAISKLAMTLTTVIAALMIGLPACAEIIRSFDADIRLNKDCSLDITETILMDFEDAQRHGIYRVIPVQYSRYGANYTTELTVKAITDETGRSYKYEVDRQGRDINIKIGDAGFTMSGAHTYVLHYVVKRAVNFFSQEPEVYWNVTGNEWPFAIEQATANFFSPPALSTKDIKTACYKGPQGSSQLATVKVDDDRIVYSATDLSPAEGLTMVARLPAGSLERPSLAQEIAWWFVDWWPAFIIPSGTMLFLYLEWLRSGRDDDGDKPIAVEWNPPKDLTPAEVGTLIDEKCHTQDIVSTLIDLAARGYLKISEQKTEKLLFFSTKDYEFEKLKDPAAEDNLRDYEKLFFEAIFPRPQKTRRLSELRYNFAQEHLSDIRDQIYDSLVAREYFRQNPETVRNMYYAVGVLLILAGLMALILATPWGVGILLSGLLLTMCAHAMPARTAKGSQALREVLGFRRFVDLAEKDRIAVLAKDDPTIFGRLLPYAVVLGVADQWAEKFKDLLAEPPSWYEPYGYGTRDYVFYPDGFVHDLGGAMNTMGATFSTPPPSSSSSGGGGGYSGMSGGFSGGGFGGGGGGSW